MNGVLNESILRSSSARGLSSALCDPSLAARATSCRRRVTRRSWMGISSTEISERESCRDRTIASMEIARLGVNGAVQAGQEGKWRTAFVQLPFEQFRHGFWMLAALGVVLDDGA